MCLLETRLEKRAGHVDTEVVHPKVTSAPAHPIATMSAEVEAAPAAAEVLKTEPAEEVNVRTACTSAFAWVAVRQATPWKNPRVCKHAI